MGRSKCGFPGQLPTVRIGWQPCLNGFVGVCSLAVHCAEQPSFPFQFLVTSRVLHLNRDAWSSMANQILFQAIWLGRFSGLWMLDGIMFVENILAMLFTFPLELCPLIHSNLQCCVFPYLTKCTAMPGKPTSVTWPPWFWRHSTHSRLERQAPNSFKKEQQWTKYVACSLSEVTCLGQKTC